MLCTSPCHSHRKEKRTGKQSICQSVKYGTFGLVLVCLTPITRRMPEEKKKFQCNNLFHYQKNSHLDICWVSFHFKIQSNSEMGVGGTSSLLQAPQESGTHNTPSPFIAPIPQILPIPCVILCCPSALLPIYHVVSPFSTHFLLFSEPLMHSSFPHSSQSSLKHQQSSDAFSSSSHMAGCILPRGSTPDSRAAGG